MDMAIKGTVVTGLSSIPPLPNFEILGRCASSASLSFRLCKWDDGRQHIVKLK
jgi:hypothetical protein